MSTSLSRLSAYLPVVCCAHLQELLETSVGNARSNWGSIAVWMVSVPQSALRVLKKRINGRIQKAPRLC